MVTIGQNIIVSWKESLEFLKPKTLSLFLLLALRRLLSLYSALLYAWFLPIALIGGVVLNLKGLILAFYVVLLLRAARPSIEQKKVAYWQQVTIVDLVLFFGIAFLFEIPYVLSSHGYRVLSVLYDGILRAFFLDRPFWGLHDLLVFSTVFLSPFVIVWALFMLDAQKTPWQYVKAFGRTIVMILYNYPFFFIVFAVVRLLLFAVYGLASYFIGPHSSVGLVGWILYFGVIFPFYICFFTNFYVKRLHDQMGLYYKV